MSCEEICVRSSFRGFQIIDLPKKRYQRRVQRIQRPKNPKACPNLCQYSLIRVVCWCIYLTYVYFTNLHHFSTSTNFQLFKIELYQILNSNCTLLHQPLAQTFYECTIIIISIQPTWQLIILKYMIISKLINQIIQWFGFRFDSEENKLVQSIGSDSTQRKTKSNSPHIPTGSNQLVTSIPYCTFPIFDSYLGILSVTK